MIGPIQQYHKAVFPTANEAQAAESAMMGFVSTPEGMAMRIGPDRIVLWSDGTFGADARTLYMSAAALRVLNGLVVMPATEIVEPTKLPPSRSLMVGDDRDWGFTGGRPE